MSKKALSTPGDKIVRCAIYTRKSTEEGLQQEFNSLDAQRESSEAYIASMKHEGWVCLPDRYDDGGFTGGNVDRPAVQRLLKDIQAHRREGPSDALHHGQQMRVSAGHARQRRGQSRPRPWRSSFSQDRFLLEAERFVRGFHKRLGQRHQCRLLCRVADASGLALFLIFRRHQVLLQLLDERLA